jgi:aldehyde dehydrogenase (NAD+)
MASPVTPDVAVANLQATALTARCHNVFFRQKQLKSLHDSLRNNSSSIKDAIKRDSRVSDAEATTEVALALDVVKAHYDSIDTKEELKREYRISSGANASDGRDPWGVIYIEPQQNHTPLYSAVVALSAALVTGNCVALKVCAQFRRAWCVIANAIPAGEQPPRTSVVTPKIATPSHRG